MPSLLELLEFGLDVVVSLLLVDLEHLLLHLLHLYVLLSHTSCLEGLLFDLLLELGFLLSLTLASLL